MPEPVPLLIIISGPAGSGKTTLCDSLLAGWDAHFLSSGSQLERVITATTREPRSGEQNGVDYFFLTKDEFEDKVAGKGFFEHATVFQNRYGILKSEIHGKLKLGKNLLINIDVQGAATFRKNAADDPTLADRVITVFIMPPNTEVLQERLLNRGQNNPADMQHRLHIAEQEMKEWVHYDYTIISGTKEEDFDQLLSIIRAERLRVRT